KTRNGRYLVGTQGGLYELRHDHAEPIGEKTGLPPNLDITALLELPSGGLVVGTLSEQLYLFDGHKWFDFGPQQGIPRNAPFFMTLDDRGYLWIAGIRGVARVPVKNFDRFARGEIKAVGGEMLLNERGDRNAGQQGFCCNGAGMSKGFLDGHVLWLPTRDGVVALDTHGIVKNRITAAPLIERIRYLGGWHALDASNGTADSAPVTPAKASGPAVVALELEPRARDVSIEFTAPSFQDPRSIQMRYRLFGYDVQWHDLDDVTRRSVSYTNLPPGDYTFEVRASNNAGVWSPATARQAFSIRPWFYETRMFYLLIGLLLAALMYAIYRKQRLAHIAQRGQLEQEVRERTRQLHAANERLENSSQTDPLTSLRNRRYLANQLPADFAYYDREQLRSGDYEQAILFSLIDIDQFEHVNELHGRKACDRALQQMAQLLQSLVRGGDYVVRWDGDQFLLVFRPMPMRHVEVIGERLRAAVAAHVFEIGNALQLRLTCSIGFAEYPLFRDAARRLGWEQMVGLAAGASVWVKNNGRDGWAAFRPTALTDLAALTRDLHVDPHKLIAQGQLQVRSGHGPSDADRPQG
ncbi:MAG: diguanylate cyclase, partial [Lysobacteraceae bacterium]